MKKTLVTILAAAAVVASSYGQGTVTFANATTSLITKQTSPGVFVNVVAGDLAKVELLWAPAGTTDIGLFQIVGATAAVGTPSAARFSGGTRTIPAGTGLTGIQAGGAVALAVRGFIGADYASASLRGVSSIIQLASTGNPLTVPAGTPTAIATLYTGVQLSAVPEPTSMALAGIGAASLLIFRRRK